MKIVAVEPINARRNFICTVEINNDRFVNCSCLELRPDYQKVHVMQMKDGSLVFDSKGNSYPGYPFSESRVLSMVFFMGENP